MGGVAAISLSELPASRRRLSSSATGSLCEFDGHVEAEVQCAIRVVERRCGSRKRPATLKNAQCRCQGEGTLPSLEALSGVIGFGGAILGMEGQK